MSTGKELLEVSPEEDMIRLVNLNELIHQALKPFMVAGRNKDVIVRCSDMPFLKGDRDLVRGALNDLVRMMMQAPGSSKRFLHVKCRELPPVTRHRPDFSAFLIEFHTNLYTDTNWKQLHQETIISCQERLLTCNAKLMVHDLLTSGCLFSISLQGKIL